MKSKNSSVKRIISRKATKGPRSQQASEATSVQLKIFELFGAIEYDPQYNYKKERHTRRK